MTIRKLAAAFLSCVLCVSAVSCGKNETKEESSSDTSVTSGVGELITPKKGDQDEELGSYRVSQYGTKLYYDDEQYSADLVLTLDKYFNSLHDKNFETYKECLFPSYAEEMNKFLLKEYQYGLERSFDTQWSAMQAKAAENYTITRIKAEPYGNDGAHEDTFSTFFNRLGEYFENDYYKQIQEECDKIYDVKFSVFAEFDGAESLIISDMEMIMVEKDGKFYNFG